MKEKIPHKFINHLFFKHLGVRHGFFNVFTEGRYNMKYTAEKIAPVLKNNNLAIIKRIDEVPRWEMKLKQKQMKQRVENKNPSKNPFENWIMPEEPHGYIKAKTNDFL
ncbi:MAG: hypothetical protein WDN26_22420 [Chitinophagaceae bacterium]